MIFFKVAPYIFIAARALMTRALVILHGVPSPLKFDVYILHSTSCVSGYITQFDIQLSIFRIQPQGLYFVLFIFDIQHFTFCM